MAVSARLMVCLAVLSVLAAPARAMPATPGDWTNTALSADRRAAAALSAMTLDEKLSLVHGIMAIPLGPSVKIPPEAILGAGYVPGVPRLGIPALTESDASLGVAYVMGLRHDGATALPSGLASAASWDPEGAYQAGAMIGQEAWRKGFNVLLAGGADLAREPRNGRNFEYLGEDPLLAGSLAGEAIRGIQDQHVISTLKHFALNDQETGRHVLNVVMDDAPARESDLLAFELALEKGHPASVMCSYNRVNGPYACDSAALLNDVLKKDWHFPGFVMSDWGAVPDVEAAMHGLDQESGAQLDDTVFFDAPLRALAGKDPKVRQRLDDMVRRILRSMFAVGLVDHPPVRSDLDMGAGATVAQRVAQEGIVLLANPKHVLPLNGGIKRIAIIGGHADIGVISGGGSSQVAPPGGPAATIPLGGTSQIDAFLHTSMYMPSSPLKALQSRFPSAQISYDSGSYPSAAAAMAAQADVAIVFATKWMGEGSDTPDLTLPDGQDALIARVAAANPNTIVVLETGGPVVMPWLPQVAAVAEAWFPGARGGEAIADILSGAVNPSGHLPITFPADMRQLPNPQLPGADLPDGTRFDVHYPEGADVGYRWFDAKGARPLFPFGFGLSYTEFSFGVPTIIPGEALAAQVNVANTGERAGAAVAQLYLTGTPSGMHKRLVGWQRVELRPGESRTVSITIEPRLLADWQGDVHRWRVQGGTYTFAAGGSSQGLSPSLSVVLKQKTIAP